MKKALSILFLLCLCSGLFAYTYYIKDSQISIEVGKNAVHTVNEEYTFNFMAPMHGFYRYIPTDYSQNHAKVINPSCSDRYSYENEDGYFIMKIGSESSVNEGLKDYEITYSYDLGADRNQGYDEFYFNILGSDWEVPVEHVSFSIFVPCKAEEAKIWLTKGRYGSSSNGSYTVYEKSNGILISGEAFGFSPYEALTLRIQLPDGWYQGAREPWDKRDLMRVVNPVVSIILLGMAIILWSMYGHDRIPIVSSKFEPPEGMSPLAVGYLVDEKVDDKDLTAMFFYWADKGFITISEKKKDSFVFTKIADLPEDTPSFEKTLFYGMFRKRDEVTLDNLKNENFYEVLTNVKLEVLLYFRKDRALVSGKSRALNVLFTVLSMVPGFLLMATHAAYEFAEEVCFAMIPATIVGVLIVNILLMSLFRKWYSRKSNGLFILFTLFAWVVYTAIMLGIELSCNVSGLGQVFVSTVCSGLIALFAQIMPRRSEYGHKLFEEVLGYRQFIDMVSMSELTMMIDSDPEYYYHVLSYAIALGLENKWAKKFESVSTVQPHWYYSARPMDVYFYSRMSTRMMVAVKAAAIPANIKNSGRVGGVGGGFNIGGFAGGGFGGGGGRAW